MLLLVVLFSAAKDSIPGIVSLPVSLADRTANIERACDFLKEKGVNLPSDIVKGTHTGARADTHIHMHIHAYMYTQSHTDTYTPPGIVSIADCPLINSIIL